MRSHSPENLSDVVRVIEEPGNSEVAAFLGKYGTKLEPAVSCDVQNSLHKSDLKVRLLAAIRLCQGVAYGADCATGHRIASALLVYMRDRWVALTRQDSALINHACACALSACVYAQFNEGLRTECIATVEEASLVFPTVRHSSIFWSAVATAAIAELRRNRVAEAKKLLLHAPRSKGALEHRVAEVRAQVARFARNRFVIEDPNVRLSIPKKAELIWRSSFSAGATVLRRLRESLSAQPERARVGFDLVLLSKLEAEMEEFHRISRRRISFDDKYAKLAREVNDWFDDVSRFISPLNDPNHINSDWVERAINKAARAQASLDVDPVEGRSLLADLDLALAWTKRVDDKHKEWMALWAQLLVYERLMQADSSEKVILSLCESIREAQSRIKDVETRSNVTNFLPGLASKACKVFDLSRNEATAWIACELRKSRSLLANEADCQTPDARKLPDPEALGPRVHYLSLNVFEIENRIQALLYTADGSITCLKIDMQMSVLRDHLGRLDPSCWAQFVFKKDPRPLVDALSPLLAPLEQALRSGHVSEGDHICVAADDPVHLVPLQYLPLLNRPSVELVSISRVTSFSDALRLVHCSDKPPSSGVAIFVPTLARDPTRPHRYFIEAIGPLENGLASTRKFDSGPLTAREVVSLLRPDCVIHIHAHGTAPPGANPFLDSGLVVSRHGELPDLRGLRESLLTPAQVLKRRPNLSGSHITLSACVSGVGKEGRGGDVLGLEFAFRRCGASSLLATHWEVLAQQASEFSAEFYRRWLGGDSRAEAWRSTTRHFMSQAETAGAAAERCAFSLYGAWH